MTEEKVDYQVIRNFGPSVFKVKIPKNILESLNNITDEILLSKEKQQKFDHGNKLIDIYYSDNSANSVWGHQMYLFDAIRFCRDLDYDGYNDWYLPTEKQLKLYTQSVGDIVIPNTNNLSMNVFGVYDYLSFHTFDTGISQYGVSGGLRYFPQHDHMSGTEMTRNCFCVR